MQVCEGRLTSAEFDLGKLKAFNLKKTEEDVAALQDKLKDVDLSLIKTLNGSVEKLQNSVSVLEKNPVLTAEEKTQLATLKTDLKTLTDDLNKVTGKTETDRSSLTTAKTVIDELLASLKTKADAATVTALTEQIDRLQIALNAATNTSTSSAETFTKRIAELEAAVYKLQDPRVDIALTQFVNAFVGTSITETGGGHSGNLNPGAQMPFGMVSFGPDSHAQYIIPVIMRKNFSLNPGGLPGNDDMGATSGWYVWSALGLYPVIPSAPGMAISTPQFSGATLWLGNGKKLRIETDKQALLDDVRYISEMKLGDAVYQGTWLPLDKIRDGGKLSFKLSATPTEWGTAPELTPPSGPAADYTKATVKELPGPKIIQ